MRRRKRHRRRRAVFLVVVLFGLTLAGSYLLTGGEQAQGPGASPSLEQPAQENVSGSTEIIFRQRFEQCGHINTWLGGDMPAEFALINFADLTKEQLEALLPANWRLTEFSSAAIILESVGGQCRYCLADQRYIGVHDGKIAIFRGLPPAGSLEQVTPFEVKEDVREQLEKGITFSTEEELLKLLESYTS
ncbi:MAG: BofC C-terminal domain-containing protein [Dethiobacter sp.]|jgi:hypothetical protein|nr:BofC C-terminal domain-containing protein [Dethiobacter sp.]